MDSAVSMFHVSEAFMFVHLTNIGSAGHLYGNNPDLLSYHVTAVTMPWNYYPVVS